MATRRRGWKLPGYATGPNTEVFQANGIVMVKYELAGPPGEVIVTECETIAERVDIDDAGGTTPVPPGIVSGGGSR